MNLGDAAPLEIRTRWIWRVVCPLVIVAYVALGLTGGSWWTWASAGLFVLVSAAAWRNSILIADGVILRRSVIGWNEPLVLDALASVSYYRGGRTWTPYLQLTDRNGTTTEMSLRWWSDSRLLLDIVVDAAGRSGAELDSGARRKLGPRRVA